MFNNLLDAVNHLNRVNAVNHFNRGEILVLCVAILCGFALAQVIHWKALRELQRAPYFAISAFLALISLPVTPPYLITEASTFIVSSISIVLTSGISVISHHGFSRPFAIVEIRMPIVAVSLYFAVIGYLLGFIAIARSRDAFGPPWYAILALIPVVNLLLFLRSSEHEQSPHHLRTVSWLHGNAGVASGLLPVAVLIGYSFLLEASSPLARKDDDEQFFAALVQRYGANTVIRTFGKFTDLPNVFDEKPKFEYVVIEGNRLRRTFWVSFDGSSFDRNLQQKIEREVCTDPLLSAVVHDGVSIDDVYVDTIGLSVKEVTATLALCLGLPSDPS
jgi:hypothetical protein